MDLERLSIKNICFVIGAGVLAIALLFHVGIYLLTSDIRIVICTLLYTIALCGLMLLFAFLLRKKIKIFSDEICKTINYMMYDTDEPQMSREKENLLSKIHHRLLRLYKIMQRNRSQVDVERKDLQELISDISHQVKTPIANLKMVNATLLNREMEAEERKNFLEAMDGQINKLDFLMQSMIKTSRLENGMINLATKPDTIYETIAIAMGDIFMQAEKKKIDITVDCNPQFMICHDRKWTAEVLFNILENAVKYTKTGGMIHVAVQRMEIYSKIAITDNGKGIPESHHAGIFKRFYREEEVQQMEGIGIGLYLARKIVSLQGGYMTVTSEVGKGSTFSVFLLNK